MKLRIIFSAINYRMVLIVIETLVIYFFYAPGLIYNVYNATIEGNFVGPQSPHTETAKSWLIQSKFGFSLSWKRFDLLTTYYFKTKETLDAEAHQYVGITLNSRF